MSEPLSLRDSLPCLTTLFQKQNNIVVDPIQKRAGAQRKHSDPIKTEPLANTVE